MAGPGAQHAIAIAILASAMPDNVAAVTSIIRIVDQDAHRSALEVIKLPVAHCPEESSQTDQPEAESNRDEQQDAVHRTAARSRNALATTSSDEPDMARAAMSGVTSPAIASGTAMAL